MTGLRRGHAWRVVTAQLRANLSRAATYRADFVLEGVLSLAGMALTLLPLLVLFDQRGTVAGWDEPSALIVVAYFMALRAILEGVVNPALVELVGQIRNGSFDYVLLKPTDAQLLVTTARQDPWQAFDVVTAIGVAVYAFWRKGVAPAPQDVALGLVLLVTGAVAMYAVFITCAAASFWVVRLDNLVHLLGAVFDAARWPVQVFRGAFRFVFTFVIPVALMTTFPVMALLGRLDLTRALETIAGTLVMLAVSRAIWRIAIRNYTSASS